MKFLIYHNKRYSLSLIFNYYLTESSIVIEFVNNAKLEITMSRTRYIEYLFIELEKAIANNETIDIDEVSEKITKKYQKASM